MCVKYVLMSKIVMKIFKYVKYQPVLRKTWRNMQIRTLYFISPFHYTNVCTIIVLLLIWLYLYVYIIILCVNIREARNSNGIQYIIYCLILNLKRIIASNGFPDDLI